jgi:hypothetical protein
MTGSITPRRTFWGRHGEAIVNGKRTSKVLAFTVRA